MAVPSRSASTHPHPSKPIPPLRPEAAVRLPAARGFIQAVLATSLLAAAIGVIHV